MLVQRGLHELSDWWCHVAFHAILLMPCDAQSSSLKTCVKQWALCEPMTHRGSLSPTLMLTSHQKDTVVHVLDSYEGVVSVICMEII